MNLYFCIGKPVITVHKPIQPEPSLLPSSVPIKEGTVEKRGHSAKYLMFSK